MIAAFKRVMQLVAALGQIVQGIADVLKKFKQSGK